MPDFLLYADIQTFIGSRIGTKLESRDVSGERIDCDRGALLRADRERHIGR